MITSGARVVGAGGVVAVGRTVGVAGAFGGVRFGGGVPFGAVVPRGGAVTTGTGFGGGCFAGFHPAAVVWQSAHVVGKVWCSGNVLAS